MPISNPWSSGLGKLMVPNVFVNIDLLKLMVKNYDAAKRCILLLDGTGFISFTVAMIQEVFGLDFEVEVPLSFNDLEEENRKMDTTHQGWNLVFHKAEKGRLTEEDGPPYDINIFKKYFQYTYMAC